MAAVVKFNCSESFITTTLISTLKGVVALSCNYLKRCHKSIQVKQWF
uniref:Uncharacterized protein n=1 Tax=Rhodnius prolixus TaxID=13249 RepID=A0A905R0C5_RHOPR